MQYGRVVRDAVIRILFFFVLTLVTGPRRSLIIKLSDTRVYAPQIRARLETTLPDPLALPHSGQGVFCGGAKDPRIDDVGFACYVS